MKIVLCDDDEKDMERLERLLLAYGEARGMLFSIDTYTSGIELLGAINQAEIDVLFLDINMESIDGLTLASKIREHFEDVPIILVTAHINYAIAGYKVKASRFLVKDDLEKTIGECMDDICARIGKKRESLIFSCVEGKVNIRLSEIFYVEVSGHRSMIKLSDREYHIYETLDKMEQRLKDFGFVRAHQSYLVNIRHIQKINNYVLTLDMGKEITVPRKRYKQLRQEYTFLIGQYL